MLQVVEQAGVSDHVEIDSAGTSAYHAGERADRRARATAKARGFELPSVSRQFLPEDFERFDYVLAMDRENLQDLRQMAKTEQARSKLHLFRSFDPEAEDGAEVPDPYYGGEHGFEDVFDLCEAACRGLLEHLRREHDLK